MTPTPMMKSGVVKGTSTITLLAGLWLFISPWLYHAHTVRNAWNSWIVGAFIAILAAIRLSSPVQTSAVSWINCLLGIWTFASPWIFGYMANTGRVANSLVVGVVVFGLAIINATAMPHMRHAGPQL